MTKFGYVFEKDYRIKFIQSEKTFRMLAKTIKEGGVKQENGWYLNPIKTIPTCLQELCFVEDQFHTTKEGEKKNKAVFVVDNVVYVSRGVL